MAKKNRPDETPRQPELRVPQDEASSKLVDRIVKGRELLQRQIDSVDGLNKLDDDYNKWNDYNGDLLRRLFTTDRLSNEYDGAGAMPIVMSSGPPSHAQRLARRREYISGKIRELESITERLELFVSASAVLQTTRPTAVRTHTNRAFLVHGHDEAARELLARFLERLSIEAIILHEQPSQGRTVIEKLEHYSDVDFAIILLTPDDVGASNVAANNLQPRARQNVILELGYFAGKLGRKHVCAMYQGPLETPSDYVGVVYIDLDTAGGWQLKLARELRAAGFTIDMNVLAG